MEDIKNLNDEELVELVRNKDQELYSELVKRYQNKLIHYALYLIQDEDKAADIVQESFIKAFINLNGFNIKKKFSSWIYRIVHNETINYIRKHKKEISLENNKWIEETIKGKEDVEESFNKKEVKEMLDLSLKELPIKYRSPLTLFYLEEKTYEEISDVLRMPVGTVGTRINRGKKMLKVIYKKKEGENYAKR